MHHRETKGSTLLLLVGFITVVGSLCAIGYWQLTHINGYRVQLGVHVMEQTFMSNVQLQLDAAYRERFNQGNIGSVKQDSFTQFARAAYANGTTQAAWGNTTVTSDTQSITASKTPLRLLTPISSTAYKHNLNALPVLRFDGTYQHIDYTWTAALQAYSPFDFTLINSGSLVCTPIDFGILVGSHSLAWVRQYTSGTLRGLQVPANTGNQWGVIGATALPAFTNLRSWSGWTAGFNQDVESQLSLESQNHTFDGTDILPTPPAGVYVHDFNGTKRVVINLGALTTAKSIRISYQGTTAGLVILGPNGATTRMAYGQTLDFSTNNLSVPQVISTNTQVYLWGELDAGNSKPLFVFTTGSYDFNAGDTFEFPTNANGGWGAVLGGNSVTIQQRVSGGCTLTLSGLITGGGITFSNGAGNQQLVVQPHPQRQELVSLTGLRLLAYNGIFLTRRDLHDIR